MHTRSVVNFDSEIRPHKSCSGRVKADIPLQSYSCMQGTLFDVIMQGFFISV